MKPGYIDKMLAGKEVPFGPRKIVIDDPFHNRKAMMKHGKGIPGAYVYQDKVTGATYVGGALNLYSGSSSYFFPSIVGTQSRRVYRYFYKYGYDNLMLTYFIMPTNSTVTEVMALEQFMIDTLKPDLNVDPIAGGMHGYHEPMSEAMRIKLRKERGTSFFVYDSVANGLLFYFDSIQNACDTIHIHRSTINSCLESGGSILYMDRFIFSTEPIDSYTTDLSLSLEDLQVLFKEVSATWTPVQPASKAVLAENVLHPHLTASYPGINEFARAVKGDRGTIRDYVNGVKPAGSLYRRQWKLTQL